MTMTDTDKVNRYSIAVLWATNEKIAAIKMLREQSDNSLSACKRALESVYGEFGLGSKDQRPLLTNDALITLSNGEQEAWLDEQRQQEVGIALYRAVRYWQQDNHDNPDGEWPLYDNDGNYNGTYNTNTLLDLAHIILNTYNGK
jgi:hypothetical protein